MAGRARFVEPDMSRPADPENLQIDPAGFFDLQFVARAVIVRTRRGSIRNVHVLRGNVDAIEKGFPHPALITVRVIGRHGVIFVEVERDNAGKIEAVFLVQPDQFAVEADGRGPGRQSEHGGTAGGIVLPNQAFDQEREMAGGLGAGIENERRNLRMGDVVGRHEQPNFVRVTEAQGRPDGRSAASKLA